jgi:hypothetical protein
MTKKEQYQSWRERITENLEAALSQVPENPMLERYNAQNIKDYLQSLATLDRLERGEA